MSDGRQTARVDALESALQAMTDRFETLTDHIIRIDAAGADVADRLCDIEDAISALPAEPEPSHPDDASVPTPILRYQAS